MGAEVPGALLEGWVHQEQPRGGREIFAFLRDLFLRPMDVGELRARFLAIDYPGNFELPNGGEDHYVYAGEVGTSDRYAPSLLMANGRYRRQTAEAFGRTEWLPREKTEPATAEDTVMIIRFAAGDDRAEGESNAARAATMDREALTIRIPKVSKARYRHILGARIETPARTYSWSPTVV
jgi:hypothetical protein